MLIYFFAGLLLSIVFALIVRFLARRLGVLDMPDGRRKLHEGPVALLGGVGLFAAFWGVVLYLLIFNQISGIELILDKLMAAFVASTILLLVGVADDIRPTSPWVRLVLVIVAIGVAVGFGLTIGKITNPLGGIFELGKWGGIILSFAWLLGVTFTTKILDGLDGLATGVGAIASLMIFFLTQTKMFYQPNVGLVALVFSAVLLGFLLFNFSPASLYLGESGGLFIGFMIGVLAIISGSKIATALLVMAIPALDLARVLYVRWRRGQKLSMGDREHLHFQLIDHGWSVKKTVLFFYGLAALFGISTLFLQSYQKLLALCLLLVILIMVAWRIKLQRSVK